MDEPSRYVLGMDPAPSDEKTIVIVYKRSPAGRLEIVAAKAIPKNTANTDRVVRKFIRENRK